MLSSCHVVAHTQTNTQQSFPEASRDDENAATTTTTKSKSKKKEERTKRSKRRPTHLCDAVHGFVVLTHPGVERSQFVQGILCFNTGCAAPEQQDNSSRHVRGNTHV